MSLWFVDNAATGTNAGTSWANAWESFANIVWGGGGVVAGDTVYISGGSSSKTYRETLTVGGSGTAGNVITITAGANAPSVPSTHIGTVIIDAEFTRADCIYMSGRTYVTVNGISGSTYKILARNAASDAGVKVRNSTYINIDDVQVENPRSRGVYFDSVSHSRVHGCNIQTGIGTNNYQTDLIYTQYGHSNIIEYNVCLNGNRPSTQHIDCLQMNHDETDAIVRGNWFEHLPGAGSSFSQALIVRGMEVGMTMYVYNNVIIGSQLQQWQAAMFCDNDGYSHSDLYWYYIWNNIIISKWTSTLGIACRFWHDTNSTYSCNPHIAEFSNNICYCLGGNGITADSGTHIQSGAFKNNLIYQNYSGITLSTGNITGTNPSSYWNSLYKAISASAPWIGAGLDLSGEFTTDINLATRSAWDMGAYEYAPSLATGKSVYDSVSLSTYSDGSRRSGNLLMRSSYESIGLADTLGLFPYENRPEEPLASLEYVLQPGSFDSIAFYNLDATTIDITLVDSGVTHYSDTITLNGATEAVRTDIPEGITNGTLTIHINKDATPKCGEIVIGLKYQIGDSLLPYPVLGINDYSIKEADTWGNYTITERSYGNRADFNVRASNLSIDEIYAILAQYRATPAAYILNSTYSSMILYGFYRDFSMVIFSFDFSDISMSIEGLT